MTIDEMLHTLEQLKSKFGGDTEVYSGGNYCSEVSAIVVQGKQDPYVPKSCIRIWNKT